MAGKRTQLQVRKELNNKIAKSGEYWIDKMEADLGNHSGVVAVPNTSNMVYCRLTNGQVVQAFNNLAPNIYNWKVFIGRDKSQPSLLKVIEVRWVYNIRQTVAYVLFHHQQHEYPAPDTVWIRRDQFLPLLVLPNGGLHVRLYGDLVYSNGMTSPLQVPNVSDIDLSSHAVSSGARYVLMEVLPDGTLNYKEGAPVESLDILRLPSTPIPTPTAGAFPICAIEFYEGQAEIRRDSTNRNIIDLRMFTTDAVPDPGQQWHDTVASTILNDTDEFGVWNTGAGVLFKITWASIKAVLKTYFDTIYATIVHPASDVTIADTGGYFTSPNVEGALQELGAGSGGGGGGPMAYEDLSSQAGSNPLTLSNVPLGEVLLFYNTTFQSTGTFTVVGTDLTTSFTTVSGDKIIVVYGVTGTVVEPAASPALRVYMQQNFTM